VTARSDGSLHLSPRAGRGRRALARRVRGRFRESEPVERAPHPDPLPASGEREQSYCAACDSLPPFTLVMATL
jgi:hypothetical protein